MVAKLARMGVRKRNLAKRRIVQLTALWIFGQLGVIAVNHAIQANKCARAASLHTPLTAEWLAHQTYVRRSNVELLNAQFIVSCPHGRTGANAQLPVEGMVLAAEGGPSMLILCMVARFAMILLSKMRPALQILAQSIAKWVTGTKTVLALFLVVMAHSRWPETSTSQPSMLAPIAQT